MVVSCYGQQLELTDGAPLQFFTGVTSPPTAWATHPTHAITQWPPPPRATKRPGRIEPVSAAVLIHDTDDATSIGMRASLHRTASLPDTLKAIGHAQTPAAN